MEDEIRKMALQDQLTEIYNRRGFIAIAEQQLKAANRTNKKLLLFFIDLDDMKLTNDNWGHKEGDRLLVDAADILKQTFRESDIIARIGGDEFAVLALDASEPAEKVLLRLEEQINYHNVLPNHHYTISLSVGAVIYDPEIPCSLDELMSKADRLMYEQKKARRRKKHVKREADNAGFS
jgi:diguanylate cyclase (GGDEF)-like protein